MTNPKKVRTQTLEQIISGDFSRAGDLAGKAAQDVYQGIVIGPESPIDSVVKGFFATAGAGLSVNLDPGDLIHYNSGVAVSADTSPYELARSYAVSNIVLGAADPVNPRIDLIYATVATQDTDLETRKVRTVAGGPVVDTAINTTTRPSITLAVQAGTPGANPAFPSVPANAVPLWYVYVPSLAVSVNDDHLMDARHFVMGWEARRRNTRETGFPLGTSSGTDLVVGSGYGAINGARLRLVTERTFSPASTILEPGHAAIAASTEYHVFAVAASRDTPVGKNVTDGIVFSMRSSPPSVNGTATLKYNPLQGTGVSIERTATMLYLGTVRTNAASSFEIGCVPLNRDGQHFNPNIDPIANKFPIGRTGFLRAPSFFWSSASQVVLGPCSFMVDGIFGGVTGTTVASMAANLASGVVEAPSTWYYVYFRKQVSATPTRTTCRTWVAVISNSRPTSTGTIFSPEAGFAANDYIYVGSVYNNSAGDFEPFYRNGELTLFQTRANSTDLRIYAPADPGAGAPVSVGAKIPAHINCARIAIETTLSVTSGAGNTSFRLYNDVGLAAAMIDMGLRVGAVGGGAAEARNHLVTDVMTGLGAGFQIDRGSPVTGTGGAFTAEIWQIGYTDNVYLFA